MRQKKKVNKKFEQTYESYFTAAGKPNIEESKETVDPEYVRLTKDEVRHVESQLWLSGAFPLKFK